MQPNLGNGNDEFWVLEDRLYEEWRDEKLIAKAVEA